MKKPVFSTKNHFWPTNCSAFSTFFYGAKWMKKVKKVDFGQKSENYRKRAMYQN